jgi:hypothetical protein
VAKIEQRSLSKLEKFGLWTGIVGLAADLVSLSTFAAGFWDLGPGGGFPPNSHSFLIVITGILMLYAWFVIAWAFARRRLGHLSKEDRLETFDRVAFTSSAGVGLLIIPLIWVWSFITASGTINFVSSSYVSVVVTATPSAIVTTATPVMGGAHLSPSPTPNLVVVHRQILIDPISKTTLAGMASVCCTLPTCLLLIYVIYLCLLLLMPNFYSDLL